MIFLTPLSAASLSPCVYCREPTDKAADEEEWEREIAEEIKEMKEDLRDDHDKAMEQYRKELDRWKQQKLDKVNKILHYNKRLKYVYW